ncbi:MAG: hypothetical protein A2798_00025 [Candidatus Levybacteria bacterium RIFCSPHIGHO2_01_FULL_37_17]|nr:MAG: hypothetical protein A2798_00025 [Candidatus Levybacteria bacterium RIFCSPHIGHO2_01_FULL_37_17]OGH36518.1 MAG: hypothetical protein A2959_03340 [Candidatus Levybacteria bacterium RIFCSPLOWO2_01_FULL_38_23]
MFAQAHVYHANFLSKSENADLLFASIFPDIAWTSKGKIDRNKIHSEFAYSLTLDSRFKPIVEGLKYHLLLDYYTHDFEGGYAFNCSKDIDQDVADLLGIEKGRDSLLMAHNFIEAAVDLSVIEKFSNTLDLYKNVMSKAAQNLFSEYSSLYLGVEKKEAEGIILDYIQNLAPSLMSTFNGMAEKVLPILVGLKFSKSVDSVRTKEILNKAIDIVSPTYLDFLNHAISREGKKK